MSFKLFKNRFFFSIKSKNLLKYSSFDTVSAFVNKSIKNFLMERCAGLGFIPNVRPSLEAKYEDIKLIGDYTMNIDTALWRTIKENILLEEDLLITKEELLLIMYRILIGYNLENETEILKTIKNKIDAGDFKKLKDIVVFIEGLKKQLFDNENK